MTPLASSNRTPSLLLAALVAAGSFAVSTAHAQTTTAPGAPATPAAPAASPKAFAASVKAAKTESAALAKKAADTATRSQKALGDTEAAKAKLAAAAPTPTQKDQLALLDQQILELKVEGEKLGKISAELTNLDTQVGAIASETACASETKGPKPKITAAKRIADGVVGSSTSESAVAKTKEKAEPSPKVKQILATYAKDVQAIATSASKMAGTLTKLGDQAGKLAACP